MPDLKGHLRVEVTYDQPNNLDVLDDINTAIRKIADIAGVPYNVVSIVDHEYDTDTKVATFTVDPKDVG